MEKIDEIYSINTQGLVFNTKTNKILKSSIMNTGYVRVSLYGKTKTLHRLLAIAFIDNPNNLKCINHIDGNKQNNSLTNLEWCTYSSNMQHSFDIGLRKGHSKGTVRGVFHGRSQFTEKDIINIKNLKTNKTNKEISQLYNCNTSIIQRITNNKTYI